MSNDNIKSNEIHKELNSTVSYSNSNNSNSDDDSRIMILGAPDFDNDVTHGLPGGYGYNSEYSSISYESNENNFKYQQAMLVHYLLRLKNKMTYYKIGE